MFEIDYKMLQIGTLPIFPKVSTIFHQVISAAGALAGIA